MEHHEEGSSYQDKFAKDVLSVLEILRLISTKYYPDLSRMDAI